MCIFEPTPLIHTSQPPAHGLEYKWVQTGTLQASSHITSLSWNLEGTRLLTGGLVLEMWHEKMGKDSDEGQEASNGENCLIKLVFFLHRLSSLESISL